MTHQEPLPSRIQLALPFRAVADTIAQLHFRYFESTHRVLHAPIFWTDCNRYWDNPDRASLGLRFGIFLVVAIRASLFDREEREAELCNMVRQWLYATQTWLSGPWEKDRLNITMIQVYCLTIVARQIYSLGGDLVWTSIGGLTHRAMQIGLHRDPKHLPTMTVLQAEVRRRL